jgi:hypothetical protein
MSETKLMGEGRWQLADLLCQALASLTSLPLAGRACIAAALRFTPPPVSPPANDHEVLDGSGRRPASCPAMRPAVTAG